MQPGQVGPLRLTLQVSAQKEYIYILDKVTMHPFVAWSETIGEATEMVPVKEHPLEQSLATLTHSR